MTRFIRCAVLLALVVTAAGCGDAAPGETDVLSGLVTVGGQPARDVTVIAVGASNAEGSGLTDDQGRYTIHNPPKGKLRFKLTALVPPPPPGVTAPPPVPGAVKLPKQYATTANDLEFEFTGGRQTFDIHIKP